MIAFSRGGGVKKRHKQALGKRSIMAVRPHVASDGIMTMR